MIETTAPDVAEYSAWQTIGEAAAAARVSERTLRKRIKAGEVQAVKTAITGGGVAWRVAPEPESGTETAPEAERKSEPEARRTPFERETQTERKRDGSETENAPEVSEPRAAPRPAPDARADLLAHLRTENEYLKSQVDAWRNQTEAANRTANEAMASLRKALDAAPKAITGGDSVSTQAVARDVATGCDESGQPANHKGKAANAPQRTPQREMRPLWKVILGIR